MGRHFTRRALLTISAVGLAGLARAGDTDSPASDGRLRSRPGSSPPTLPAPRNGEYNYLGLDEYRARDALLYAPTNFRPDIPTPLLVMLHGFGSDAMEIANALRAEAETRGFLLLAPCSRGISWDEHRAPASPDTVFIDASMARTFAMATIDPKRMALGGMSDGASYALSLGLANGDLFSDVLAFSPAQLHYGGMAGHPRFFISHGHADSVVPFRIGKQIAEALLSAGCDVTFREFDGGHQIPQAGLDAALTRFLG